jgi:hypothetical protein
MMSAMPQLAQVNVARLLAPLESEQLAGFVAALDPVNATADEAPGFVWRLQDDSGDATSIEAFQWDTAGHLGVIVNLSVWTDLDQLTAFVYSPLHREVLRQRRQWFAAVTDATTACWWVPDGHLPTTTEAEDRIRHLREHGPSPWAFTLRTHFPPEEALAP